MPLKSMVRLIASIAPAIALFATACTTVSNPNQKKPLPTTASSLKFVTIGDMPYNKSQVFSQNNLTRIINNSSQYPFVVHHGDFKPGRNSPCTVIDDNTHLAWIRSLNVPVFYTPGDNEWTDCDRNRNSPVTSSLNRLTNIRTKFFNPIPHTTPAAWNASWQASMPENAMWSASGIVFMTIHTVGSNNGRKNEEPCASLAFPTCDDTAALISAAEDRDKANLEWIGTAFKRAVAENSPALVISTQADVMDTSGNTKTCTAINPIMCDGFAKIKQRIILEASVFDKPVLLLHGDTNPYCWDKGFGGSISPNLWRLNAAGDFWLIDAIEITVDPSDSSPFHAKGLQSRLTPANGCWIP